MKKFKLFAFKIFILIALIFVNSIKANAAWESKIYYLGGINNTYTEIIKTFSFDIQNLWDIEQLFQYQDNADADTEIKSIITSPIVYYAIKKEQKKGKGMFIFLPKTDNKREILFEQVEEEIKVIQDEIKKLKEEIKNKQGDKEVQNEKVNKLDEELKQKDEEKNKLENKIKEEINLQLKDLTQSIENANVNNIKMVSDLISTLTTNINYLNEKLNALNNFKENDEVTLIKELEGIKDIKIENILSELKISLEKKLELTQQKKQKEEEIVKRDPLKTDIEDLSKLTEEIKSNGEEKAKEKSLLDSIASELDKKNEKLKNLQDEEANILKSYIPFFSIDDTQNRFKVATELIKDIANNYSKKMVLVVQFPENLDEDYKDYYLKLLKEKFNKDFFIVYNLNENNFTEVKKIKSADDLLPILYRKYKSLLEKLEKTKDTEHTVKISIFKADELFFPDENTSILYIYKTDLNNTKDYDDFEKFITSNDYYEDKSNIIPSLKYFANLGTKSILSLKKEEETEITKFLTNENEKPFYFKPKEANCAQTEEPNIYHCLFGVYRTFIPDDEELLTTIGLKKVKGSYIKKSSTLNNKLDIDFKNSKSINYGICIIPEKGLAQKTTIALIYMPVLKKIMLSKLEVIPATPSNSTTLYKLLDLYNFSVIYKDEIFNDDKENYFNRMAFPLIEKSIVFIPWQFTYITLYKVKSIDDTNWYNQKTFSTHIAYYEDLDIREIN